MTLIDAGGVARATCTQCTHYGTGALNGGKASGDDESAFGFDALHDNISGNFNTATGVDALLSNTGGSDNTATGVGALEDNISGVSNTATGVNALEDNISGNSNTAIGGGALDSNTTGSGNIAVGLDAGDNLTTGSENIDIYDAGVAGESNTIRIGTEGTQTATYIAGIYGVSIQGSAVCVNSSGHLGTCPDPMALNELHRLVRENRRQAEQIGKLDKQIDALKKKDAQIDALLERVNALERQARVSRPEHLAAATR